jgi:hypothetical protein
MHSFFFLIRNTTLWVVSALVTAAIMVLLISLAIALEI